MASDDNQDIDDKVAEDLDKIYFNEEDPDVGVPKTTNTKIKGDDLVDIKNALLRRSSNSSVVLEKKEDEDQEQRTEDEIGYEQVRWSDTPFPSMSDHHEKYTMNQSFFKRTLQSLKYDMDQYVTAWCQRSGTSASTGTVFGVKQFAQWTSNEKNKLHFFVPEPGENEKHIPIEIFLQIWDWDTYSGADLIGAKVVDFRPVLYSGKKGFALDLWEGRSLIGTLFVNAHITTSDHLSPEHIEEMKRTRKETQETRFNALKSTIKESGLKENVTDAMNEKLDTIEAYENELKYELIEVEILRFDGAKRNQNNLEKYKTTLCGIFALSIWVLGAAGLFTALEDWNYSEALYWALVTMSTVGYGDLAPESDGGRAIASIWIIGCNLLIFVVVLGWMKNKVEEAQDDQLRNKSIARWLNTVEQGMHLRVQKAEALTRKKENEEEKEDDDLLHLLESYGLNPEVRKIDAKMRVIGFWIIAIALWIIMWTVFFSAISDASMDVDDAIWFAIVTSTTVGYGDYHANGDNDARIFIIFFILFGVAGWANLGAVISDRIASRKAKKEMAEKMKIEVTARDLERYEDISPDVDNVLSRADFIHGILLDMELVDPEVLDKINEKFKECGGENDQIVLEVKKPLF